jgi:hypothetical protein
VADENENYWRDLTGIRITRPADTRDLITVPCFTPSPFTSKFWDDFSRASDQDRRGILKQWLANRESAPDGSEAATVLDEQIGQLTAALTNGSPPVPDSAAAQIRESAAARGGSLHERGSAVSVPTAGATPQSRPDRDGLPEKGAIPTIAAIKVALDSGQRKEAVRLRIDLERCSVKTLWSEAFSSLGGSAITKRTAFNRWQASRKDTPSWADSWIRARLLK